MNSGASQQEGHLMSKSTSTDIRELGADMRLLDMTEIDATAGAGIWSWIKSIFGGGSPRTGGVSRGSGRDILSDIEK